MTDIIRLSDNEGSKTPVNSWTHTLSKPNDDLIAIEKFICRFKREPERVFVCRNTMYIPVREGEK